MNNIIETKRIRIVLIVCSILLLSYTSIRAYFMSFTYDESWTYLSFVHLGFTNFKHFSVGDTNNHLLNTWLMELSIKLFGESEFTLRLPNLFAHVLFLFYSAKLVLNFRSKTLIITSFLLLNINPYFLDFFSLARGYGLSMGLLMASLYYAYRYIIGAGKLINGFWSLFFAALALLAYFIMINFLLILSTIILFKTVLNIIKDKSLDKRYFGPVTLWNSLVVLLPVASLFYVLPIIFGLKKAGSMDFGGKEGFWHDTVVYLINCVFWKFPKPDLISILFQVFVAIVIMVSLISIINFIRNNKSRIDESFLIFLFALLILSSTATIIQFKLMHILYPGGRYSMNNFLFFMLLLVFLAEHLCEKFKRTINITLIVLTFLFSLNFAYSFNLIRVHDWASEADTRDMIKFIMEKRKDHVEKENVAVGVSFQFNSDANFYRIFYHQTWMGNMNIKTLFYPLNDYYYIERNELKDMPKIPFKIIKEYPNSNTLLIENEQKWTQMEIYRDSINFEDSLQIKKYTAITKEHPFNGKYCMKLPAHGSFSAGMSDSVNDNVFLRSNMKVVVHAMIYANSLHNDALYVVSHQNGPNVYNYFNVNLMDFITKEKVWTPVNFTAFLPKDVKLGDQIVSYIWNVGRHDIYVDDMEFKILAFDKK